MVRAITTSSASASAAPSAVRGAFATDPVASEGLRATVSTSGSAAIGQANAAAPHEIFRYNSFEFVYRQDVGRIVLIGQSPETGETVVQVPSERALRLYAQTAASARFEQSQLPDVETDSPTTSAPAPTLAPPPSLPIQQALTALVGTGSSSAGLSVSA